MCMGDNWFAHQQQDILDELMGMEPWSTEIATATDLTLFAMAVQTEAQRQAVGGGSLELSPGPQPPVRGKASSPTRILWSVGSGRWGSGGRGGPGEGRQARAVLGKGACSTCGGGSVAFCVCFRGMR